MKRMMSLRQGGNETMVGWMVRLVFISVLGSMLWFFGQDLYFWIKTALFG